MTVQTTGRAPWWRVLPTKRAIGLILAAVALVLPNLIDIDGLSEAGERMLGIFGMAIVLWVTEAIPLYATAVLIILLEVLLVSNEAIWDLPADFEAPDFREYFNTLAHPVILLFLGGFFLAHGAAKFGTDRWLARVLLRPFGDSPRMIILGLMLVTALLSMFMSNTAITATLMAVVLPVIARLDPADRLRAGLALAIPVAANLGGIGTPVGTPPNAIAVGTLSDAGIEVSFLQWMVVAIPMLVVLLFFAWFLLTRLFPAKEGRLVLDIGGELNTSRQAIVLYAVAVATIALWLTQPVHGVSSSIVGFGAVVALLATGVFAAKDLQAMPWHILWLVAGGIALGIGVAESGLATWFVDQVSWPSVELLVALMLAAVALALSTVISNSAAANLLIPIGLTLTLSGAVDLEPVAAAFFIAVGASLAMALPVSTPPNAVAYSTGAVKTRDMAVVGLSIGAVGLLLYVFVAPVLWDLMGIELS